LARVVYVDTEAVPYIEDDCAACETEVRMIDKIEMAISLTGDLSEEQQRRLREIAGRCPVHRTLISTIQIHTTFTPN
jgi:putative redox protein